MSSAKHNSTMEKAMGLISSLLNITSSQSMPFHQPQYVQCTYHGLTFVPFVFQFFLLTMQGVDLQLCIMGSTGFVKLFSCIF